MESSRNGSGEVSIAKRSYLMNATCYCKPENTSGTGSTFTIRNVPTSSWMTKPLGRFSKRSIQYLSGTGSRKNLSPFFEINVLGKGLKTVLTNPSTECFQPPLPARNL